MTILRAGRTARMQDPAMSSTKEYQAKAKETLAQIAEATSEGERARLRRTYGVYRRLAAHEGEAAERAAMRPAPRIKPEKPPVPGAQRAR